MTTPCSLQVFGFLALGLFVVDVILHYKMYSAMTSPQQTVVVPTPYQQFPAQQGPGEPQAPAVASPLEQKQNIGTQEQY